MTMTRITRFCSALALSLAAAGTQAANYAGNTFEIEMIIFERPQGMAHTSENWPASPRLEYPSRWVDFDTRKESSKPVASRESLSPAGANGEPMGEAAAKIGSTLLLSPTATMLNNKAAALARGGDRVLFHKAWRQVLKQKRSSPAVLIDGGDSFQGYSQLGGSVTLSVSRYLHLSTNLWLNDFSSPASDEGILLPKRPRATAETPVKILSATQSENKNPSYSSLALQDDPGTLGDYEPITLGEPQLEAEQTVYVAHAAHLQHERRLRSGQLHYIDHPAFGILIEIRTVAKPKEEDIEISSSPIEGNTTNIEN